MVTNTPNNSLKSVASISRNLTIGNSGDDVKSLQKYLNSAGFKVSQTGVGSPGQESTTFGAKTKVALTAFQKASGVTPPTGYFGPLTRKTIQGLYQKAPATTTTGCSAGQKYNTMTGVLCGN